MVLKLTNNSCSLCKSSDVSFCGAETTRLLSFIKEELGSCNWDDGFHVCVQCAHSLDLLQQIVAGAEKRNAKSCFCCKSVSNLFKQSDLPRPLKDDVDSFASVYTLKGPNICIHCFFTISFWAKVKTLIESSKHTRLGISKRAVYSTPISTQKHEKRQSNEHIFEIPRNADKLPAIRYQLKKFKTLKTATRNKKLLRKFSDDNKLINFVPFVYVNRIEPTPIIDINSDNEESELEASPVQKVKASTSKRMSPVRKRITTIIKIPKNNNSTPVRKPIYTDTSDDESSEGGNETPVRLRKNAVVTSTSPKKKQLSRKNQRSKAAVSNSYDSDESDSNDTLSMRKNQETSPIRFINNRIAKVVLTPLKKNLSKNLINDSVDTESANYSVTSNGSSIVIKRVLKTPKAKPVKRSSTLRTIRIQPKKSSSSETSDVSPPVNRRSPITLPPKKNKKRILDMANESSEETIGRRTTRNRQKDIEEIIIDNTAFALQNETQKKPKQVKRKVKKKVGRKAVKVKASAVAEKDPLEIDATIQTGSETDETHIATVSSPKNKKGKKQLQDIQPSEENSQDESMDKTADAISITSDEGEDTTNKESSNGKTYTRISDLLKKGKNNKKTTAVEVANPDESVELSDDSHVSKDDEADKQSRPKDKDEEEIHRVSPNISEIVNKYLNLDISQSQSVHNDTSEINKSMDVDESVEEDRTIAQEDCDTENESNNANQSDSIEKTCGNIEHESVTIDKESMPLNADTQDESNDKKSDTQEEQSIFSQNTEIIDNPVDEESKKNTADKLMDTQGENNSIQALLGSQVVDNDSQLSCTKSCLDEPPLEVIEEQLEESVKITKQSQPDEDDTSSPNNAVENRTENRNGDHNVDSQATVLMSNSDNCPDDVSDVSSGDFEELPAISKGDSSTSTYQDAQDNDEHHQDKTASKTLPCEELTNDSDAVDSELKDEIEDTLNAMHRDSDSPDEDVPTVNGGKRKRDSDSPYPEDDAVDLETPRTKRVRFAAEKKVLNEDDSICLEDLDNVDGDVARTPEEQSAEAEVDSEVRSALNM